MESEPHDREESGDHREDRPGAPLAELLPSLPPYDFVRRGMVREGIEQAELEERYIDDRTARHIAMLLARPDSLLEIFAATGEVAEEIGSETAALLVSWN